MRTRLALAWLLCAFLLVGCTNHCRVIWGHGVQPLVRGAMGFFPSCAGVVGWPAGSCSIDGAPFQPCGELAAK